MKLGPLGFLALVGGLALLWGASRVPVIIANARIDVASSQVVQLAARFNEQKAVPRSVPTPVRCCVREAALRRTAVTKPVHPDNRVAQADKTDTEAVIAFARAELQTAVLLPPPQPLVAPIVAVDAVPILEPGFALASAGYDSLRRGDRRGAARGFAAALSVDRDGPNTAAWRGELAALRKRWSADAYVLVRGAGLAGLGVAPLFGGGQSGGGLAYKLDPLSPRPIAIIARASVAHQSEGFGFAGVERDSALAALGARWQATPALALTVERQFGARRAWAVRAAGGVSGSVGPVTLDAYAEAGVVGARRRDGFASGQARATLPLPGGFDIGFGGWGGIQRADDTVHRIDTGPTLGWRSGPLSARADWRFRVAGNAAPSSGPALTLSAAF